MSQDLKLFSPEFALEEINVYKNDIIRKTGITSKEFSKIRTDLAIAVEFIPVEKYTGFLKDAINISPDPNDIDFLALAIKLNVKLWSNDSNLKNQRKVQVYSTSDLLDKLLNILFKDDIL
jgi:predicted nucleic acid-binding protein